MFIKVQLIKVVLLIFLFLLMSFLYHWMWLLFPAFWHILWFWFFIWIFVQSLANLSIIQMHYVAFGSVSILLICDGTWIFYLMASSSLCLILGSFRILRNHEIILLLKERIWCVRNWIWKFIFLRRKRRNILRVIESIWLNVISFFLRIVIDWSLALILLILIKIMIVNFVG